MTGPSKRIDWGPRHVPADVPPIAAHAVLHGPDWAVLMQASGHVLTYRTGGLVDSTRTVPLSAEEVAALLGGELAAKVLIRRHEADD